jgi:hypothetical protein
MPEENPLVRIAHFRNRARQLGLAAAAVIFGHGLIASAQELEPRRWSHLPINVNFAGAGYAFTVADIYFDPLLQLQDVELDLHTVAAKYIRTAELFGRAVRADFTVPYQQAEWNGLVQGVSTNTSRSGFADPVVRLSLNLVGGPPLDGMEFAKYRAAHPVETIVGVGLAVQLPLGEYYEDKLLNLGENRFTIRPELGVLHTHRKWSFEVTGTVGFFTDNDEFWNGNEREQDPLYGLQGHVVYTFRPGLWLGASTGYRYGGRSQINGVAKDDRKSELAWALSVGYPINKSMGLKLLYLNTQTLEDTGLDSDSIAVAFSVLW